MTSKSAGPPDERTMYRQFEIARMLGISVMTWRRLRATGKVPPPDCEWGHTRLWKRETVERWIESQRPAV
jgi:predicted site-specific integrase-resolvase